MNYAVFVCDISKINILSDAKIGNNNNNKRD